MAQWAALAAIEGLRSELGRNVAQRRSYSDMTAGSSQSSSSSSSMGSYRGRSQYLRGRVKGAGRKRVTKGLRFNARDSSKVRVSAELRAEIDKILYKRINLVGAYQAQGATNIASSTGVVLQIYPTTTTGSGANDVFSNALVIRSAKYSVDLRAMTVAPAAGAFPDNRVVRLRWALVTPASGMTNYSTAPTLANIFFRQNLGSAAATFDQAFFQNWSPKNYRDSFLIGNGYPPLWTIKAWGYKDLLPLAAGTGTTSQLPEDEDVVVGAIGAPTTGTAAQQFPTGVPFRCNFCKEIGGLWPNQGRVEWTDSAGSNTTPTSPVIWLVATTGDQSTNGALSIQSLCEFTYST